MFQTENIPYWWFGLFDDLYFLIHWVGCECLIDQIEDSSLWIIRSCYIAWKTIRFLNVGTEYFFFSCMTEPLTINDSERHMTCKAVLYKSDFFISFVWSSFKGDCWLYIVASIKVGYQYKNNSSYSLTYSKTEEVVLN